MKARIHLLSSPLTQFEGARWWKHHPQFLKKLGESSKGTHCPRECVLSMLSNPTATGSMWCLRCGSIGQETMCVIFISLNESSYKQPVSPTLDRTRTEVETIASFLPSHRNSCLNRNSMSHLHASFPLFPSVHAGNNILPLGGQAPSVMQT